MQVDRPGGGWSRDGAGERCSSRQKGTLITPPQGGDTVVGMSKLSSNGFYFVGETGSKEAARGGREEVLGLWAGEKLGGQRDIWNHRAASGTCLSLAVMNYSAVSQHVFIQPRAAMPGQVCRRQSELSLGMGMVRKVRVCTEE